MWDKIVMPIKNKDHLLTGKRYEASVPDTLDLTDRAEFAINALTGIINEKQNYECLWRWKYVPLTLFHHSNEWNDSNPRSIEALTLLRLVTGSNYKLAVEETMLDSVFSRIGDDGLFYNAPYRPDAPWRSGGYARVKTWRTDEDYSSVPGSAQLLIALLARYQAEHDSRLLKHAEKLVAALLRIAVYKDDYAYYPMTTETGFDCGYFKKTGWPDTKEPLNEFGSPEGCVNPYYAIILRALSRWYALTGDKKAIETARKLTGYMLKPNMWLGNIQNWGTETFRVWSAHGGLQRRPAALFKGHVVGLTYTLHGLIEYARITNNAYLKEFVRQGYEHIRNFGLARIGMYGENIANNLMAAVAIRLSDAGVGDYWEDVDQHVRNAMVEDQFIDAGMLREISREKDLPGEYGEWSIERLLGALRHDGGFGPHWVLDPTNNGTEASVYVEPFYYVWESITRYNKENGYVNLLLNRVSPWCDIDSHLPYEGKVTLHNKTCRTLSVRMPKWVDKTVVTCRINDKEAPFFWTGNYMTMVGLYGREKITIKFPMVERVEEYYLLKYEADSLWYKEIDSLPRYVLHMKGNTCVKVEFPNKENFTVGREKWPDYARPVPEGYPVYQRDRYRKKSAPLKEKTRYVAPLVVDW